MPRFGRSICVLAGVALVAGCALVRSPEPPATGPSPVAVVLQGSAFEQAATRERTRAQLEQRLGRPVAVLDGPADPMADARSARLLADVPGAKRYDRREPGCAKEWAITAALGTGADVVYRLRLDYAAASRGATAAERERGREGVGGMLTAVGLAQGDAVLEETLTGEVERASLDGTHGERRRVTRTERHVAPTALTTRLDLGAEAAAAVGDLPTGAAPRWDAVARRLVAKGCPLLALAVEDAFVRDQRAKRRVHAAAVAAIRQRVAPRKKAEPPASEGSARSEPEDPATEPGAPTNPQLSCRDLCELHMVELCNNDRALWTQHRTAWESTRCGARRTEPFLESCYRMHWLDGTYEQACLQPCEGSGEGRDRLLLLLRRAGCLRTGA